MLAAGSMLDHDAPTLLRAAAAAGFDGVGLRLSADHELTDGRQADDIRSMAEDLGLAVHDAEVVRIDGDWRTANRPPDRVRWLLETAARIGASAFLVVSDLPDEDATVEAVAALVEEATPLGLTVGLEYMAWTTPATPATAVAMAEAAGCRVVVDVLHHVRVGAGIDELRHVVATDRLGWVQICDAVTAEPVDRSSLERGAVDLDPVIHEARHGRLAPGRGVLALTDFLAAIPEPTVISVEVQSDDLVALEAEDRARLLAVHASNFCGSTTCSGS